MLAPNPLCAAGWKYVVQLLIITALEGMGDGRISDDADAEAPSAGDRIGPPSISAGSATAMTKRRIERRTGATSGPNDSAMPAISRCHSPRYKDLDHVRGTSVPS